MNTTMTMPPNEPHSRVEVIRSVQRRRRWSAAEKVRLVEEAMQPGMRRRGRGAALEYPLVFRSSGNPRPQSRGRPRSLAATMRSRTIPPVTPVLATADQAMISLLQASMTKIERRFGKTKAPHPVEWLSELRQDAEA